MNAPLTRLHPAPRRECALQGLYLAHGLHRCAHAQRPFVYSNFIASLDGRISEQDPQGRRRVPTALANPRDWALYLELLAQADVLLTSSRHLRAVAEGRQTELLTLPEPLMTWRREQGLSKRPAWAVISRNLNVPARRLRERHRSPLLVLTCDAAPAARRRELEAADIELECVNRGERVDAGAAIHALTLRGVRSCYAIAGPRLLHSLLDAAVLDRLYLTLRLRLLGGDHYDTLLRGPALEPPMRSRLRELYLDADQLFACLEPQPGRSPGT